MSYVDRFFGLECCGDVLNAVGYLGNKPAKEVTETMGVIKYIRRIALRSSNNIGVDQSSRSTTLYDLCAGNALTSVLAVHLFPFVEAIAIDKEYRDRRWNRVKRFRYHVANIYSLEPEFFDEGSTIIAVHACAKLARRVVDLYNASRAQHLILMPCCHGQLRSKYPELIVEKLGKYVLWAWDLAQQCKGSIVQDMRILSPKNCIVTASKGKRIRSNAKTLSD